MSTPSLDRRLFLKQSLLAASALGVVSSSGRAAASSITAPPRALPPFSWDRVPAYGHLGKSPGDFTPSELDFLARRFDLVTIEKGHAVARRQFTEDGIHEAARALKRLNPRLRVLFYWNAFINYPLYRALERFKPQWQLRDARGNPVLVHGRMPRPDLSLPEVREWWSDAAAAAMRAAPLDGIFADALPQALSPALRRQLGEAKADAVVAGLQEMLTLTKEKIGPDRIILANGLRAADCRQLLDWPAIDGLIIEHFGHFASTSPQDMKADLDSLGLIAARGKFGILKGWPGFTWLDEEMMRRPRAELLELARGRITFPLACYLAAAREQSWFCYSWGYREMHGTLDDYPELSRPLGPPRAPAAWDGLTATRRFAHASVQVDLSTCQSRISW